MEACFTRNSRGSISEIPGIFNTYYNTSITILFITIMHKIMVNGHTVLIDRSFMILPLGWQLSPL